MANIQELREKFSHIPGWGVDIDPTNEPTHPMKKYTGDDHKRFDYERAEQQPIDVEVLHSNERPNVTRVFGATLPPSGLSGVVRRQAFKWSEGKIEHWLLLLLADRINVVEGFLQDFSHGKVPNIFAEKGWKADWKHNKQAIAKRAAVVVVAATLITLLVRRNKHRSHA
jgi:hypothetical protein